MALPNQILLIVFLLTLTTPFMEIQQQKYTQYTELDNPRSYNRMLFSSDMTLFFLYSKGSQYADVYSGYNWSQIANTVYRGWAVPANNIDYFYYGGHNFLYGTQQGDVFKKQIVNNGSVYTRLWVIDDQNNDVEKVTPSPNRQVYAAYCNQGYKVYIGDLFVLQKLIKQLNFEDQGVVRSIRWKSKTSELAISGGNSNQKRYLLLYNYTKNTYKNITNLASNVVADMAFSPDDTHMYFIEEPQDGPQNEAFVKIYDFTKNQTRYLVALDVDDFIGIEVKGNFVSAWNGQVVYIWDRITEDFYGSYQSSMKNGGLSVDGSDLVTMSTSNDSLSIFVNKLCQDYEHYYNDEADQCQPCTQPCSKCFLQGDKCSSCLPQHYLTPSYSCQHCMQHCLFCQDSSKCNRCLPKYYIANSTCELCQSALDGCQLCSNSQVCQSCFNDGHWNMSTQGLCYCVEGFVKINGSCQACPQHCLECQTTQKCLQCDSNQHWVVRQDYCECARRYYESENQCLPCQLGCLNCISDQICTTCDISQNWQLKNFTCVCKSGSLFHQNTCITCESFMEGCQTCQSQQICLTCQQGFTLNPETNTCDKQNSKLLWIILGIVAVLILLVVVGLLLRKYLIRSKNRLTTSLQTEEAGSNSSYNKIQS